MILTKKDLSALDKIKRLNIINSLSGIKSANLIGTRSEQGQENVAIFNSFVHIGSSPALLGFILRPQGEVPRNTFENIASTGIYTVNHVHESFIAKAHQTSAKYPKEVSEFDACEIETEYLEDFHAPFVRNSLLKMGLRYVESIPIPINNTSLVIGEIEYISVPDEAVDKQGYIDLENLKSIGISGLNSYYKLEKMTSFPFARP